MSREITVVSPENVAISYELAGLGSRGIAALIDSLIQILALIAIAAILAGVQTVFGLNPRSPLMKTLNDFATAISLVVAFIVFQGYFIAFEAARNGQTPGKKWVGLRVIREEGAPLDVTSAVVRNLIRAIELVLGLYLSSVLFILFSPRYKRLGDYAAGTIVVRERKGVVNAPEAEASRVPQKILVESFMVRDVDLLSVEDISAIRRFVERRYELTPDVQEQLAKQIAAPLMVKLGITPNGRVFSHADLLEEMLRQSTEQRGLL